MKLKLIFNFAAISLISMHSVSSMAAWNPGYCTPTGSASWIPYFTNPHISQAAIDGQNIFRGGLGNVRTFDEKRDHYNYTEEKNRFTLIENENLMDGGSYTSYNNFLNTCASPNVDSQNILHLCVVEPVERIDVCTGSYETTVQTHYKVQLSKDNAQKLREKINDQSKAFQVRLVMTMLHDDNSNFQLAVGKNNHHFSCGPKDVSSFKCDELAETFIPSGDVQIKVQAAKDFESIDPSWIANKINAIGGAVR